MCSSVSAQTIGETLEEFILGTECEQDLRSAERFSNVSIYAANAEEWDWAFRNDEMAWNALIMARSSCEDEPENLKTAEEYFEEHKAISERLVCSYHAFEARKFIGLAKEALEQALEQTEITEMDVNETLFNTRWATYYLEEAIERCAFSPEKVKTLTGLLDDSYNIINTFERWVKDFN